MADLVRSTWRALGGAVKILFRLGMAVVLLVGITLAGYVLVKGMQPVGVLSAEPNNQISGLQETSYWEFMAGSLAASRQTPVNCHRTRLAYLAIALPLYPAA